MSVDLGNGVVATSRVQQLIEFYNNPTGKVKEKTVDLYAEESGDVVKIPVRYTSMVIQAGCAVAGTAVGVVAGRAVGTCLDETRTIGPKVGGIIGGAIGGYAGNAIGKRIAKRTITIVVTLSPRFKSWQRQALRDDLYPLFENILGENVFADLVCPITRQLPVIPVKTPCGHIYEKEAIEQWLNNRREGARYCSFDCEKQFTVNELTYSGEHVRKITEAANEQIRILKDKNDAQSRKLVAHLSGTVRHINEFSNKVIGKVVNKECEIALERDNREEFLQVMGSVFDNKKKINRLIIKIKG